jgi:hypothetical protein
MIFTQELRLTPDKYPGGSQFESRPGALAVLIAAYPGFLQSLEADAGIVPWKWRWSFLYFSFTLHGHCAISSS